MPSYAYLGPGMGGGVFIAVIGFIAAFFLALWAILYYPIKRSLKKWMKKKQKNDGERKTNAEDSDSE